MAERPPWVIAEPPHRVVGVVVWAIFLGAGVAGLAATISLRRRAVPDRRPYWLIGLVVTVGQWELLADLAGWGVSTPVLLVLGHAIGIGAGIWTAWDIRRRYFPRTYQRPIDLSALTISARPPGGTAASGPRGLGGRRSVGPER